MALSKSPAFLSDSPIRIKSGLRKSWITLPNAINSGLKQSPKSFPIFLLEEDSISGRTSFLMVCGITVLVTTTK